MKNLADIVEKLAKLAGIDAKNDDFVKLIQNKTLADTSIPEKLQDLFSNALSKLFTVEAAKNDPELKKHFTALALNGVDTELEKIIDTYDIDDETKTLLKNTESTYKKVTILPNRLKEKYEKLLTEAKKGKGGEDAEKLKTEITNLNTQLKGLKETTVEKILYEKALSDHTNQILDLNIKTLISSKPLLESLPRNVAIAAAKQVFDETLGQKKLKVVNDNGNVKLQTSEGTDYFENNEAVTVDKFTDKILADNKLLQVSKPGEPTPSPSPKGTPQAGNGFYTDHAKAVEDVFNSQAV